MQQKPSSPLCSIPTSQHMHLAQQCATNLVIRRERIVVPSIGLWRWDRCVRPRVRHSCSLRGTGCGQFLCVRTPFHALHRCSKNHHPQFPTHSPPPRAMDPRPMMPQSRSPHSAQTTLDGPQLLAPAAPVARVLTALHHATFVFWLVVGIPTSQHMQLAQQCATNLLTAIVSDVIIALGILQGHSV